MNKSVLTVKLINVLESAADERGFEFITVEVTGAENHPTITVYLDCEDGINIDQIAEANSWVSELVEEILKDEDNPYTLDISSPGINRPLRTLDHFQKAVGQTVVIKYKTGPDSSTKSKGELVDIKDAKLLIKTKTNEVVVMINEVISAHISQKIVF